MFWGGDIWIFLFGGGLWKCVFWTLLFFASFWCHGDQGCVGDAERGWSGGKNRLSITIFSFEKTSKKMVLKRPLRSKKFEILVKLRKSEFLCQNRVCRGRISGIGHRKYKNWLKITFFMKFLKFQKFRFFFSKMYRKLIKKFKFSKLAH